MVVVVVATESWVALELFSISIDVVVVVEFIGSSESLVLSRDTSHGSVLFQIQSLSVCVGSKFLTLVPGQIRCLVNLDILDPKNMFLLLDVSQIWCSVNLDMLDPKNMFLFLDADQIWCLVNLDMLNPKNTFLPLE